MNQNLLDTKISEHEKIKCYKKILVGVIFLEGKRYGLREKFSGRYYYLTSTIPKGLGMTNLSTAVVFENQVCGVSATGIILIPGQGKGMKKAGITQGMVETAMTGLKQGTVRAKAEIMNGRKYGRSIT